MTAIQTSGQCVPEEQVLTRFQSSGRPSGPRVPISERYGPQELVWVPPAPVVATPAVPPAKPRGSRRRVLAVVLVVALGGASAVVVLRGGRDSAADRALRQAQALVAEDRGVHFDLEVERHDVPVDGDSSELTTTTTAASGEVAGGKWTSRSHGAALDIEEVFADGVIYLRTGGDARYPGASIADQAWDVYPQGPQRRDESLGPIRTLAEYLATKSDDAGSWDSMGVGVAMGTALGVWPFGPAVDAQFIDPTAILGVLAAMSDPTSVDDSGGSTLRSTMTSPDDVAHAFGRPLPPVVAELDLDHDGTPQRFGLEAHAGQVSVRLVMRFRDWGNPGPVVVPTADQIDATPWIDEEHLRALTGLTPLLPAEAPRGTVLTVSVYRDEDAGEGCAQLNLSWSPDFDSASAPETYVDLYLVPLSCALAADDTPFEVGAVGSLPVRQLDDELVEVLVGDTVVEVDSTLPVAELNALLASLHPVDIETIIAQAAEGEFAVGGS